MAQEIDSVAPVGSAGTSEFTAGNEHQAGPAPSVTAGPAKGVSSRAPRQRTQQEIAAVVQRANEHLASVNRVLQLRVDTATGLTVATISDSRTGEVLAQVPSTDKLRFAQMLAAWSPGKNLLLDLLA